MSDKITDAMRQSAGRDKNVPDLPRVPEGVSGPEQGAAGGDHQQAIQAGVDEYNTLLRGGHCDHDAALRYACSAAIVRVALRSGQGAAGGPEPTLLEAGRHLDADALPDDLSALRGRYFISSDREADAFDAALAEIVRLRAALRSAPPKEGT